MAAHSVPDVDVVTVSGPAAAGQSYLEWGPVVAGAIAAAAISFLLLSFGGAIGLSMTSPWPYAGASALAVTVAVAWWTVMVQIGSFAAGGYLAGRLRSKWGESASEEGRFRDGVHGFLVWAIGVLVGAMVLGLTAGSALQTATQTAAIGGAATVAAGDDVDRSPLAYAVDYLLRSSPTVGTPGSSSTTVTPGAGQASPSSNSGELRQETTRIFSAAVSARELSAA